MSEYASGINNWPDNQPALPDMELVNIIRNMPQRSAWRISDGGLMKYQSVKCCVDWLMMQIRLMG